MQRRTRANVRLRRAFAYLAGPSAILLAVPAGAQSNAGAAAPDTAHGQIEEIVVTARKQEERLQQTPLSVSAFTAATLERQDIARIDRISEFAPNLEINQTPGSATAANIYIRGIGTYDSAVYVDPPVAVYIDGVLNPRPGAALFDILDLERVEVLRGPQGTLFGRNTTGGAISIFTKGPSPEFCIQEKIGYGSDNEFVTRTILNSGVLGNSGLSFNLSFAHHQMDGYVQNLDAPGGSHDAGMLDTNTVWFTLHGDVTDALTFDYRFDYTDQHDTEAAKTEGRNLDDIGQLQAQIVAQGGRRAEGIAQRGYEVRGLVDIDGR